MRRSLSFTLLILSLFFLSPSQGLAFENWQKSPWTEAEPYAEKSIQKLGFGLLNTLTGWTALLFEPTRYDNKFTGIAKGAWRTITNTVGGALHVATFPIPLDVPLPDGGVHFD